jgi:hypothetical protein
MVNPQGLKPDIFIVPLVARLKSCPDTNLASAGFFTKL